MHLERDFFFRTGIFFTAKYENTNLHDSTRACAWVRYYKVKKKTVGPHESQGFMPFPRRIHRVRFRKPDTVVGVYVQYREITFVPKQVQRAYGPPHKISNRVKRFVNLNLNITNVYNHSDEG